MANPQKENGHTPIANEIMEAICRTNWSGYEIRVVMCILRKTYGWHKKEDWISLSQISDITKILRQHISRTITKLKTRNIIIKSSNKTMFNKNYEQWDKVLPKMVLPKQVGGATRLGTKVLPKMVHTKEIKETIQKKDDFSSFRGKLKHGKPRRLPPDKKINDRCVVDGQGFIKRLDHNTSKVSKIYGKNT